MRGAGKAAGAVVGAAAGAAAARRLQEERVAGAGAVLHNLLAEQADPEKLQRSDVAALQDRLGIDFGTALVGELKAAYDAYLQAVLPAGDAPLR